LWHSSTTAIEPLQEHLTALLARVRACHVVAAVAAGLAFRTLNPADK
jgi:hypothetical protein